MSNEKTGEQPSWSSRLDELDLPPDSDGAFRDRTWEKLYVRLQEKQQPRRIFWYWAAAVCLVLAGSLAVLLLQYRRSEGLIQSKEMVQTKNKPGPVHANTAGLENPPVAPSPDPVALSATTSTSPVPNTAASPTPSAATSPTRHWPVSSPDIRLKETQRAVIREPQITVTGITVLSHSHNSISRKSAGRDGENRQQPVAMKTPLAPATKQAAPGGDRSGKMADSIILAGVKLPDVRRKLKVVHVNELEEPAAAYAPTEGMAARPWFRLYLPVNNAPVNLVGQEQPVTNSGIGITRLFKISQKK